MSLLQRLAKAIYPPKRYMCAVAVIGTGKPAVFGYIEWTGWKLDLLDIQQTARKRTGFPCVLLAATRIGSEEIGLQWKLLKDFQTAEKAHNEMPQIAGGPIQ